jgi:fucose permease
MTSPPGLARLRWAGFLGVFVWGSIAGLLGAILPGLQQRAGISLDESGAMFIALSSGLVVASLVSGPLIDRTGKKRVLCTAVSLVVVALLAFEFVNALAGLLVLAFLMGAGGSALVTASHALIADLSAGHRASALNLLDLFFGVGAFVTPFAIVPLQAAGGLAAVLFALAALAALVLLYLLTVPFPRESRSHDFSVAHAFGLAGSLRFLLPALLIFVYVGTEQSVWDWQVTYFMRHLGTDNVTAARMLSVFPVAIMIGRLASNRLLLRVAPYPVLVGSTIGAALCFVATMTAPTVELALGSLFLAGLFMASVFPTTLGVLSGRFADRSGTALGLAITCGWLGSVAISPTFGFVAQRSTYSSAYLVIVGGAIAMAAVAGLLYLQRDRTPDAAVAGTRTAVPSRS